MTPEQLEQSPDTRVAIENKSTQVESITSDQRMEFADVLSPLQLRTLNWMRKLKTFMESEKQFQLPENLRAEWAAHTQLPVRKFLYVIVRKGDRLFMNDRKTLLVDGSKAKN